MSHKNDIYFFFLSDLHVSGSLVSWLVAQLLEEKEGVGEGMVEGERVGASVGEGDGSGVREVEGEGREMERGRGGRGLGKGEGEGRGDGEERGGSDRPKEQLLFPGQIIWIIKYIFFSFFFTLFDGGRGGTITVSV